MNLEKFEEEAEKLARKGIILRTFGEGKPIAYWHGFENDICISVFIENNWLNIYTDDEEGGHVEIASVPMISSTPLYGTLFNSFPSYSGLFQRYLVFSKIQNIEK